MPAYGRIGWAADSMWRWQRPFKTDVDGKRTGAIPKSETILNAAGGA